MYLPRIGAVTLAILLGTAVGNLLPLPKICRTGGQLGEKRLLPVAIVLLGAELYLPLLLSLGLGGVLVILVSIATALLFSVQLGQWLGFGREFSLLMGAGNGICGSSAVAATSLAIDADEVDIGLSISVVNLLGTLGIFAMPLLLHVFSLDVLQGGLLIGGTLQAFGQVVAAGFSVSSDVGNIATVVKMGRVLMLAPVVVLIQTLFARSQANEDASARQGVQIPLFIVGFFVVSLVASVGLLPEPLLNAVQTTGSFLLVAAMGGVGLRIQFRTLFQSGVGALLFGAAVSIVQIAITLMLIVLLFGAA